MKTQAEIERALSVFRTTVPDIMCVDDPETPAMVQGMLCMIKVLEWVLGKEATLAGLIDDLEKAEDEYKREEASDDPIS